MLRSFIHSLVAVSLVFTTSTASWAFELPIVVPQQKAVPAQSVEQKALTPEEQKVKFATDLAEQIFFLDSLNAQLEQQETLLQNAGDKSYLDYIGAVTGVIGIGLVGLAGYSAYQLYYNAKTDSAIYRNIFQIAMSGVAGVGFLGASLGYYLNSGLWNLGDKALIKNKISKTKNEIKVQKSALEQRYVALASADPQLRVKVAAVVSSNTFKVKRFEEVRVQLGQLQADLGVENKELFFTGLGALSSFWKLFTSSVSYLKTPAAERTFEKHNSREALILIAFASAVMGLWANKNLNERKEVITKVDALKKSLDSLEQDYKQTLVQAILAN
jgi:hypothetical protein